MISEKLGTLLKKNTRTKIRWPKLVIALILSNFFFFYLFSDEKEEVQVLKVPDGWVEIQLQAELLTPFEKNKKVLLLNRVGQKKLEGILKNGSKNPLSQITVLVKEDEAHLLFQFQSWEILPFLKHLSFSRVPGESHEIRY